VAGPEPVSNVVRAEKGSIGAGMEETLVDGGLERPETREAGTKSRRWR
jgi:hypothetical protein